MLQNSPSPKGGTRHLPLWGKWNGASDYGTIRIQTKSVSLAAQKALDEIPPLGVRNQSRYLIELSEKVEDVYMSKQSLLVMAALAALLFSAPPYAAGLYGACEPKMFQQTEAEGKKKKAEGEEEEEEPDCD